ncbi:MAG: hypothetical protein Q9P01_09230 [Anaerolineae bacterium]|nr:hypothetical protein [Anaerolineae bacterium]
MPTFKPGTNPFEALAAALMESIPTLAVDNPRKYAQELDDFAQMLEEKPDRLAKTLQHALKNEADWAEVLLFIDQFEELLSLSPEKRRKPFAEMLSMDDDSVLTHAEYELLGGVGKAIGTRAENIFVKLRGDENEKEQILWCVFRELVEVDENGTATRRRVAFDSDDESIRSLIDAFTNARLLVTSSEKVLLPEGEGFKACLRRCVSLHVFVFHKACYRRLYFYMMALAILGD